MGSTILRTTGAGRLTCLCWIQWKVGSRYHTTTGQGEILTLTPGNVRSPNGSTQCCITPGGGLETRRQQQSEAAAHCLGNGGKNWHIYQVPVLLPDACIGIGRHTSVCKPKSLGFITGVPYGTSLTLLGQSKRLESAQGDFRIERLKS